MQNLNDGQSGGEASHTARLAYLKAEDAHRRLDEAERIAARTFAPPLYAGLYTRTVFSGGISLPELELTCPADTAAHIEVRLVIDSPAAGRFTVTPVLGGARAEEGEGALQAGFSSHSFAFVLPLKKGAHTLGFDISAPAGSYALESAAVCITGGGVYEVRKDVAMDAFASQYGTMFALHGGGQTAVINQNTYTPSLSAPLFTVPVSGAAAASSIKSGQTAYRMCHAREQGGQLVLEEFNLLTQQSHGAQAAAQNVRAVSLGSGGGGSSCVLAYISAGKVYAALIHYDGGLVLSPAAQVSFSGSADAVKVIGSASGVCAVAARIGGVWYLSRFAALEGGVPIYGRAVKLVRAQTLQGNESGGLLTLYAGGGGRVEMLQTDGGEITATAHAYCDELLYHGTLRLDRTNNRFKVYLL